MATIECTHCGHTVEVPTRRRAAVKLTSTVTFPEVIPTEGAAALHTDHVNRRDGITVTRGTLGPRAITRKNRTVKLGKNEHPNDHAFRLAHPDTLRFLSECSAAGRVSRFHADDEQPDAVRVWLSGSRGVFAPAAPVTLTVDEVHDLASLIAKGTAWRKLRKLAVVPIAA